MPRNGSGVYSLPVSYEATTGQTASASQHNDPLEDIKDDLNAARPIVAGGTGATSASAARTNLGLANISDGRIKSSVEYVDETDSTKRWAFDLSGLTTSTTRTWEVPDASDTFVGEDATQTLTNKTLDDAEFTGTATFSGTTDIEIEDGEIRWLSGPDYIKWISTEGLCGYENGSLVFRIGSGQTTRSQAVYDNTSGAGANVFVGSQGSLLRSTSSGEYKIERREIDTAGFMDLLAVSFQSTHEADNSRRFMGFIAEDVAEVFPEASMDDGQNYDVRALVAVNWTKSQEHENRIAEHENRIAALERRLNAIEAGV